MVEAVEAGVFGATVEVPESLSGSQWKASKWWLRVMMLVMSMPVQQLGYALSVSETPMFRIAWLLLVLTYMCMHTCTHSSIQIHL